MLVMTGAVTRGDDLPDPRRDPVVMAVQQVVPAVVNISTERVVARVYSDPFDEMWRQFFGIPSRPQIEGGHSLGSGAIVDSRGWIVTNWHVVRRATKIKVGLNDGTTHEAQLVSSDENNDLALLKIERQEPLPHIEIATETEPMLGETVIAVGNPFGLDHTVTKGVISARNRKYEAGDVVFNDILQTDAAINPGNSGGPLVNIRGELVGINMAVLTQAQGIGFAIPARRVAGMLAMWFSPEKRLRLWLGLRFRAEGGRILVADVQKDSPAESAGLKVGDVVRAADGTTHRDVMRLMQALWNKKAGDVLKLDVERERKNLTVSVKLAALPQLSVPDLMQKKFGLVVQPLTADLAGALGYSFAQGLLVSDVERKSPAEAAGFRRGIVITHIAGEEILAMDRLAEQLADIQAGDPVTMVLFVVTRRGNYAVQQTTSVTLKSR